MGAGASSLKTAIGAASDSELRDAVQKLTPEERKKLTDGLVSIASTGEASTGDGLIAAYEEKMKKDGCNQAAIDAFKYNFGVLTSGASTFITEAQLDPVAALPDLESLTITPKPELLKECLILKLNGGLGTGMGLEKAKSLLVVNDGHTFLDLIAKQVGFMKKKFEQPSLNFMLMNSFATSADTHAALSQYSACIGTGADLEFVQNKAPKVTKDGYAPASWPAAPECEWCPPGHGDLYPAMLGSGTLDKLLAKGLKYMFVSNSDNLGATMDLNILTHFVDSGAPFMMEVAARTDADKKGGHLATMKEGGGLTLRESAQCPPDEEKQFQDTSRYSYFNTNNLWVDLRKLKEVFDKKGAIPLPVMVNEKTVDPRDKKSTDVIQLETAMGAAISCFEGATALLIPRTRFAPVKKCDDLFALRSDAYTLTEDFRIELSPERKGVPPNIKLDGRYKFVDAMDTMIPNGVPSLKECSSCVIEGEVVFEAGVICKGEVKFVAKDGKKTIAAGTYENQTVEL